MKAIEFKFTVEEQHLMTSCPLPNGLTANLDQRVARLSRKDILALSEALTEELARGGFDEDYNLSQRGDALNELINRLSRALL